MSRKTILALIFVLFAALAAGPQARAQQGCMEFRALSHAILPTPHPLNATDTWGGDVWGTIGGQFVSGYFSGNDGDISGHGVGATAKNGFYTFVLKDMNDIDVGEFTMEVHAHFGFPPGKVGLGEYTGAAKIVQGTGMFANASGNISWAGPFIVWPGEESPLGLTGRYNAEIRGNICDVQ
jgi:hypothetical protein